MERKIFFIIMVISCMSLQAKSSKFPYQEPHRFRKDVSSQGKYASGNYSIGSLTIWQIPCGEWIYFKGAFGDTSISHQECRGALGFYPQEYKVNKPIDRANTLSGKPYLITDSSGNKGVIARKYERPTGSQFETDQIILYLAQADGKSGVKLIFDVDKFEKFLTQTYEYDILKKGPEITDVILNLAFNDSFFDFIDDGPRVRPPARSWSIPWATISYNKNGTLHPITDWKIGLFFDAKTKKPVSKTVKNEDLLGNEYGKIIQILPMTNEEISLVLKQKY